jgi:hypothetical protein
LFFTISLPAIAGTSTPAEENMPAEYEEMKVNGGRKEGRVIHIIYHSNSSVMCHAFRHALFHAVFSIPSIISYQTCMQNPTLMSHPIYYI